MSDVVGAYDANYCHFAQDVLARVRREAYGEDIGQHSWLSADECRMFCDWLELGPGATTPHDIENGVEDDVQ